MIDPTVHCDCPECKKLRGERPKLRAVEQVRRTGISKNAILVDIANCEEEETLSSGIIWNSRGEIKQTE